MEDDPFLVEYDLLVCGTSLIASIVAASAAKSGKKVVHLDANSFYGSRDAALPLEQLYSLFHTSSNGDADIDRDEQGEIEIPAQSTSTIDDEQLVSRKAPITKNQRLSSHIRIYSSRCEAVGETPAIDSFSLDVDVKGGYKPAPLPKDLVTNGAIRKVITDLFPRLTHSRGPITSLLVESNTASYLEFKALEASFMAKEETETGSTDVSSWSLQRVPSSKSDVFNAPDTALSLLEKRRLMKFLLFAHDKERQDSEQAAQDVATQKAAAAAAVAAANAAEGVSAASVQRLNEKELGSGRSLLRPQNKSTSEFNLGAYKGETFKSFLIKGASLSPYLADLITYAVAQEEGGNRGVLGAEEGMRNVCSHIGALGRFGNSAFIASLYGSGELAQAFCRLCAVHGGLYMLRTGVDSFLSSKENPHHCGLVKLTDGHIVKLSKGGSILTESSYLPSEWRDTQPLSTGPIITAICLTRQPLRLLRASGGDEKENTMELVHIVVPPYTKPTLHSKAVYILQQGPGSCVLPSNHPTMRLVHISTRSETTSSIDQEAAAAAVLRTIKHLFGPESGDLAWHIVYSINSIIPSSSIPSDADMKGMSNMLLPSNISVINEESVSMYHFEQHVEQATRLLRKVFPDNKIAVLFPEPLPSTESVEGTDAKVVPEAQGTHNAVDELIATKSSSNVENNNDKNDVVVDDNDDLNIEESLKLLQGAL
jgi:RAB protein geranylgeranyltransferase component A